MVPSQFWFQLHQGASQLCQLPNSITCTKVLLGKFIRCSLCHCMFTIYFEGESTSPNISTFLKVVSEFLSLKCTSFHDWQPQAPGLPSCFLLQISLMLKGFNAHFFCVVLVLLCCSKCVFHLVFRLLKLALAQSVSLLVYKVQNTISTASVSVLPISRFL